MQSFYPSPPRHRLHWALLAVLVMGLHAWVLHSLSVAWPVMDQAAPSWSMRLQAAPVSLAPLAPAPALVTPRSVVPAVVTPVVAEPTSPRAEVSPALSASPRPATGQAPSASAGPTDAPLAAAAPPPAATTPQAPASAPTAPTAAADMTEKSVAPEAAPPAAPATQASGPPWLQQSPLMWPASTKLIYAFTGESKGIRYSAEGDMVWVHNDQTYQLQQEVRHMLMGSRSQTSVGSLGATGLKPKRFGDKGRQEVAAHFERDKGLVSFSANTPSQALQDGAQDRLSLFVQLAALLAGSPQFQQPGQRIVFQVVSARSAEVWAFSVDKTETLKLPLGPLPTVKLSRLPLQQYDQTIEMWLSPQHGFLPARVRIVQTNGDVLDQLLSKVQKP